MGPSSALSRLKSLSPILTRCAYTPTASSYSKGSAVIRVTPKVSLFDQKVKVKVQGLPILAKVTVCVSTQQEWRRSPVEFLSCGHYVSSRDGDLDLNRDASVGGTYSGLEPMGPFWSLAPSPAGAQNIRMVVRNGPEPVLYQLSLFPGHLSLTDLAATQPAAALASTVVTRLKAAANVRTIPVRDGSVRGKLFLPAGEGPHPGLIDMFGSAGGLMELRASLLASHGFAVLALPFFKYEDLPRDLQDITFDYFLEAVSWFSSHPNVKKEGIGLIAVSFGAQLALLMAQKCPQVLATVSINAPPFLTMFDLTLKGKLYRKGVKMDMMNVNKTEFGLGFTQSLAPKLENFIPVWEGSSQLLMLVSDDDQQVPPGLCDMLLSLYPETERERVDVVHYPGAGHLLEPPYNPHCKSCINPSFGLDMYWGGNVRDHAAAQEDAWNRTIHFFRKHLT